MKVIIALFLVTCDDEIIVQGSSSDEGATVAESLLTNKYRFCNISTKVSLIQQVDYQSLAPTFKTNQE